MIDPIKPIILKDTTLTQRKLLYKQLINEGYNVYKGNSNEIFTEEHIRWDHLGLSEDYWCGRKLPVSDSSVKLLSVIQTKPAVKRRHK